MNIRVSRIHKRILKEDAKIATEKTGGEEKKKRSTVLSIKKAGNRASMQKLDLKE